VGVRKKVPDTLFPHSVSDVLLATGTGAAAGLFPGAQVPGLDVGRNSMNALYKQMVTKLENGTISSVSASTAAQMLIGRAAATGLVPAAIAAGAAGGMERSPAGRKDRCQ
jgi:hypothetical protein